MKKYPIDLYSREAVLKASYAFTDDWYIHLDVDDGAYCISLRQKDGDETDELYAMFENELIAQETRRVVTNRTKNLREMIVAKALSSTIIREDGLPSEEDGQYNAEEILTDWFSDEKG